MLTLSYAGQTSNWTTSSVKLPVTITLTYTGSSVSIAFPVIYKDDECKTIQEIPLLNVFFTM